jgi:hypothetical protein
MSLTSCSQENKYFKETDKLIELIIKGDTVGIKKMVVCKVEDSKILQLIISRDIDKFRHLIKKYGVSKGYKLTNYPNDNIKLCDVSVKAGNSNDYGILTASFYRNYEPNKIFLIYISFNIKTDGLIKSPE